jgi:hypothetical protein
MFKKHVDVKALQRLSGADKKKLRRTAKERFPQASDADLDAILPPKVTISFSTFTMCGRYNISCKVFYLCPTLTRLRLDTLLLLMLYDTLPCNLPHWNHISFF